MCCVCTCIVHLVRVKADWNSILTNDKAVQADNQSGNKHCSVILVLKLHIIARMAGCFYR